MLVRLLWAFVAICPLGGVALAGGDAAAPREVDAENKGFDKAWPEPVWSKLELTPSTEAPDDVVLASLAANAWGAASPSHVGGEGSVRTLRFTLAPAHNGAGGALTLADVTRRVKGFGRQGDGAAAGAVEKTETALCAVRGPVLWCSGRPWSFVVLRGRLLVLNAVVPVGQGRWYYVAADVDKDGRVARIEEYLFEFADDPMKHNAGNGTMRTRIGQFPAKTEQMRFSLAREDGRMREVQIDVDGPNGVAHRARVALATDGLYGLMLDNPNLNSLVFAPAADGGVGKAGGPATLPAPPEFDHQKAAEQTEWHWDPDQTDPLKMLYQQGDKYDIDISSNHADRFTVRYRIVRAGKPAYEWDGHPFSVFRIVDDRLYYVRFGGRPGGTVVAVDLTTGKELWASPLEAVPVTWAYGKYRTLINLSVSPAGVSVYGCESAGRYYEDKDPATGETVGHKVFPPMPNRGPDGCE